MFKRRKGYFNFWGWRNIVHHGRKVMVEEERAERSHFSYI